MDKLRKAGAEAWPISREARDRRPLLDKVIIESDHPDGNGTIHLSPDQALYVHSRLSQLVIAFLHGHNQRGRDPHYLGLIAPQEDVVLALPKVGAEAWPISQEGAGEQPGLEKVIVESAHGDGRGTIHLSPEQALYVQHRLTHITMAFLHENVWGGEDARRQ